MQLAGHRIGHLQQVVLVAHQTLVKLVAALQTLLAMLVAAHQIGHRQPMQLAMLVLGHQIDHLQLAMLVLNHQIGRLQLAMLVLDH